MQGKTKAKIMALAKTVLDKVKESNEMKALLSIEFGRSIFTIERWIKEEMKGGDSMLSSPAAVRVITKGLNISKSEALTN